MTKVVAYIADCCGELRLEKHIVGLNPVVDMFNRLKSYPTVANPAKTSIHYCVPCYTKDVVNQADRLVNRRKDEYAYKIKVEELTFVLKEKAIKGYNDRKGKKLIKNRLDDEE